VLLTLEREQEVIVLYRRSTKNNDVTRAGWMTTPSGGRLADVR
jgi:hypothetical protein